MTEPKPTSQVLLAAETGDPLLAVGRYGLGSGLAFTSDLSETWGSEWLAWEECGRFWAQIFRAIFRKASTQGLEISESFDEELWAIQMIRRKTIEMAEEEKQQLQSNLIVHKPISQKQLKK